MEYIKIVNGDLLDAQEDYIVHQCNCISTEAKGLAKQIFDKYDYANSYKNRIKGHNQQPGTIEIWGNGNDQKLIINVYAQFFRTFGSKKYINEAKLH
jgi:O-acetyl-ADP-ribose deacetylase (regulator of RNase III)